MITLPTKKDVDKKNSLGPWFPSLGISKTHLGAFKNTDSYTPSQGILMLLFGVRV